MRRILITTLCALALPAAAKPFAEIAPADAAIVLEVPSMQRMTEGAERGGLVAMFKDRVMREFIDALMADNEVSLADLLDELRIDMDDLPLPSGQIGLAVSMPEPEAPFDAELPVFMFAEFDGDGADAHRAAMDTIIEEGLDRKLIQLQDIDPVGSVKIVGIESLIADELDRAREEVEQEFARRLETIREDGDWEAWGEQYAWYQVALDKVGSDDPLERAVQRFYEGIDDTFYAWVDDAIVVGSSAEAVADAVTAMQRGRRESLGSTRFHADGIAGLPRDHHARLLVNSERMNDRTRAMRAMVDPEFQGQMDQMEAMLEAMGFNDQTAIAVALTLGETDEVLRMDGVAFLSQVRGIFELLDLDGPAFAGSPVIPSDAIAGGRMLFDFRSMLEVANRAIAGMPAEMREQIQPGLAQVAGILGPVLAELGPEVYVGLTDFDPAQISMMQMGGAEPPAVIGISVRNEQIISNVITTFGAQVGVAAREYAGAQIFEVEGMGLGIGLGFGHLVIASTSSTEDALRRLADPSIKSFGATPEFAAGMKTIDPTGYGVIYAEAETVAGIIRKFLMNAFETQKQWNPDFETPAWVEKVPEASFFGKYLGGIASDQHVREEGLRGRVVILKP